MAQQQKQLGAFSPLFALVLVGMLTFLAVVVETIRLNTASSRLSAIADAAILSAADSSTPQGDTQEIMRGNLGDDDRNGITQESFGWLRTQSVSAIKIEASLDNAMPLLGFDEVLPELSVSTDAEASTNDHSVEVAIMVDVSASMAGQAMAQTKKGLYAFAKIFYSRERRNNNRIVSVVPATGFVNIGPYPEFFHYSTTRIPRSMVKIAREQGWRDLLEEALPGRNRDAFCAQLPEHVDGINAPSDVSGHWVRSLERPPTRLSDQLNLYTSHSEPLVDQYSDGTPLTKFYPLGNRNPYLDKVRTNLGIFDDADCGMSQLHPLMRTYKEFIQSVDNLQWEMSTNNAEGMLWAWRVLSPRWQGLWNDRLPRIPREYNDASNRKVVVLFSDGNHFIDPMIRDRKQVLICRELKRRGVEIYSIDFENTSAAVKACATPGNYYKASARSIATVLRKIANNINTVTLTK
ncbi:pilus assembly protein FlpL [Vibrio sp. S9_S30]|uniref:pilus assembly protein TadG-related protein n=1 Tax=Vibrio sp. S9_S30 TaxID=2720226 RepID=UPI0016801767|nr:pilus assembly protein FlpL [Vibrio sp. S9_S30]